MIDRYQPGRQPCALEIRIHGLLYVRVERLPHGLAVLLATTLPVIVTWLLTKWRPSHPATCTARMRSQVGRSERGG